MKSIKELFAKKVDERQEMDLLKVTQTGFWFMYWMLFASIIIEGIFMQKGPEVVGAEFIVFMASSAVVLIGWMRKGVWTYQSRKVPGVKSYLMYSLIAGVLGGVVIGLATGLRWHRDYVQGIVACVVLDAGLIFVLSFVLFLIVGTYTKRRQEKLARMAEEEFEDDELD